MASRQDSMRGDVSVIMTLPVTVPFYLFYCKPLQRIMHGFCRLSRITQPAKGGKRKTNNRRDFINRTKGYDALFLVRTSFQSFPESGA